MTAHSLHRRGEVCQESGGLCGMSVRMVLVQRARLPADLARAIAARRGRSRDPAKCWTDERHLLPRAGSPDPANGPLVSRPVTAGCSTYGITLESPDLDKRGIAR